MNKDLFKTVVKNRAEMLLNELLISSENYAALHGTRKNFSEDETIEHAKDFFDSVLAKNIAQNAKDRLT